MALAIKVVYENGVFRPLEPVDLPEGQEGTVRLVKSESISEREQLKALLGDLVQWADPSDDRHAWVENMAQEIDNAFQGLRPLSEIIIEERGEQL